MELNLVLGRRIFILLGLYYIVTSHTRPWPPNPKIYNILQVCKPSYSWRLHGHSYHLDCNSGRDYLLNTTNLEVVPELGLQFDEIHLYPCSDDLILRSPKLLTLLATHLKVQGSLYFADLNPYRFGVTLDLLNNLGLRGPKSTDLWTNTGPETDSIILIKDPSRDQLTSPA